MSTNLPAVKTAIVALLGAEFPGLQVVYDRPDGAAAEGQWLAVGGGSAGVDPVDIGDAGLLRYEFSWQVDITASSGPGHASPEEGDRSVYDLAHRVGVAMDAASVDGVQELWLAGIERLGAWSDEADGTVAGVSLVLQYQVVVRGVS